MKPFTKVWSGKSCAEAMLKGGEKTLEWLGEKAGPEAERTGRIRAQAGVCGSSKRG